jgi:hypothetical protein
MHRALGRLSEVEAVQLVEQVMAQHGWEPPATDNATTPAEITELVETVNRHPRALVLLAREVRRGALTTQRLTQLMAQLEAENPGDRENSLYASVELSLRRLPMRCGSGAAVGGVSRRWACSQPGGGHGGGIDDTQTIAARLVEVGLAEAQEYDYLRLDPALPAYLRLGQPPEQLELLTVTWAEAMGQLVAFCISNGTKTARLANRLTLLELPNLMALLDWLGQRWRQIATLQNGWPIRLARLSNCWPPEPPPGSGAGSGPAAAGSGIAVRSGARRSLKIQRLQIERLLDHGQLQAAYDKAQALLTKVQAVGPTAYPGADYDVALAHVLLGQVLSKRRAGRPGPGAVCRLPSSSLRCWGRQGAYGLCHLD